MPQTVALVACVAKKQPVAAPARDLYISDWFRKASAYADKEADCWFILSAKYGLLSPETVIEPYNTTLKAMPYVQRREWARRVFTDLCGVLCPGDRVIILAGDAYRKDLVGGIQRIGCKVIIPMEGLKIGEQLSWLKTKLEEHS